MTMHALIFAETPVKLWGLSSRQRLQRILKRIGIESLIEEPAAARAGDSVLLLRGDYLYDERLVRSLAQKPDAVLQAAVAGGHQAVAAHVSAKDAPAVRDFLLGVRGGDSLPHLSLETAQSLGSTYLQRLRKIEAPYLLPVRAEERARLEQRLFNGSYKGVTDLVTKWLWPRPAQVVTRFCARNGITPNMVTSLSLILVILAGFCFFHGHLAWGLAAAWGMTFLDTVDGKLARVTVNSSPFGNIFDHAIDLVSPPFWYLIWGLSLESWQPVLSISLKGAFWLIFGGYIAGRLVEGIFTRALEPSGIFCWRPVDSYFRLITGRRNPNLILLTLGLLASRPDLGLLAVALWTVASSVFLVVRLIMGFCQRASSGPLRSWFHDIDPEASNPSLAVRCFSNRSPR